ncbi:MAG TPA: methyltransferase domain-containing protein [Roseiflexaceae bacterium]|nr:methyltransferase domain-containing protein [Roseiflexaceae bacterium]
MLAGLERFGAEEILQRFGRAARIDRPSPAETIRLTFDGDLRAMLGLRSVLAVYLRLRFDVPRPKALLGHQHFEHLVCAIDEVRALHAPGAFGTLRLSAAGEDSSVLTRLKEELARRTGLAVVPDEGDLLLRLRRGHDGLGWEALVRLSPRPLATRAWRVCNMPGAPNATLAHAMMRLTAPSPHDTLLNLCCGSGTLLIERLALGAAHTAIGCDIDPDALRCAQQNLVAAGYAARARLEHWDATHLPLPAASADVLCADLPFGQLVGSHRENEALYPRIFAEATRVAAPAARMALLTHEVRLLERVAAQFEDDWDLLEIVRVRSGGMTPRIFVFRRV